MCLCMRGCWVGLTGRDGIATCWHVAKADDAARFSFALAFTQGQEMWFISRCTALESKRFIFLTKTYRQGTSRRESQAKPKQT